MMFLKKLCRINGASSRCERGRNQDNAAQPSATVSFRVANSVEHSTTRQRRAANGGCGNAHGSDNSSSAAQFANRPPLLLCRTPPPVYGCLPATPPPSYTPRSVEHAHATGERQGPEVLPLDGHVLAPATAEQATVERQQLAQRLQHATSRYEPIPTTATTATEQLTHQQQQRRRRLQLLQQQRLVSNIHNNNCGHSSSTGSSSSDSEAELGFAAHEWRRRRLRHARVLRDAYCPDLLNACSLILQQEPTSDSSVGSFTDTPPPPTALSDSSDYVEIDEIRPARAARRGCELSAAASVQGAVSTPELRAQVRVAARSQLAAALCAHPAQADTFNTGNCHGQPAARLAPVESSTANQRRVAAREMGQNLSLRRPRISLTWVLREQQPAPQQQSQTEAQQDEQIQGSTVAEVVAQNNNNGYAPAGGGGEVQKPRTDGLVLPTQLQTTTTTTTTTAACKKRYRLKQLPGSTEPLNGYATTPTAHMPAPGAPQKFFSNQNLLDYKDKSRKELLFVCTPQRLPTKRHDSNEALALVKKRNEIRKKLAAKMAAFHTSCRTGDGDGAEATTNGLLSNSNSVTATANAGVLPQDELKSLKGTYSEPSLVAASEGNHRRHRHRKRRERNRVPKFGYEISNVDEFLSKCSLASPGNIPVVLSASSTLYQTRPGGYQMEVPLPLGMVVNAVFKNQNWLYVQTPHAEEGYVGYACCLPLGILPPAARGSSSSKPTPCWESNGDVFPRPCGNMTDSEKEIRLRGGTRSDGARTPRGKRGDCSNPNEVDTANGNALSGEHHVDKLYLRAASQPKLVEKAYAQLKSTKAASIHSGNDEYVTLQQQQQQHQQHHLQQQKSKLHVQKHLQQQQQLQHLHHKQALSGPFITNGHNGQHLHPPKNGNLSTTTAQKTAAQQQQPLPPAQANANLQQVAYSTTRKQHGLRQTLVAINADYATESISLQKGEIVTLCECRESKDHRQWFYVRTRDGREGYIPAEVAGHGYL